MRFRLLGSSAVADTIQLGFNYDWPDRDERRCYARVNR